MKRNKVISVQGGSATENFAFTAVKVSDSAEVFLPDGRDYRTVYAAGKVQVLYADVEGINKRYGEADWEAVVEIALFRIDEGKTVCMAQTDCQVQVEKETPLFTCSVSFSAENEDRKHFPEGVYGIVAQTGERSIQSAPLYLMEGKGEITEYLRLKQVGIDKCCDETPEQSAARMHSFRKLNYEGLKDIRFYFFADNLREAEWVYEFRLCLTDAGGRIKAVHTVRGQQFIQDEAGRSLLCFALDLGEGCPYFWLEGAYRLRVFAFGQLMLNIGFTVAREDEPYEYIGEAIAGRNSVEPAPDRNAVLDGFYQLVGLRKIKEEVTRICEYVDFVKMRRTNGFSDVLEPMHIRYTGNPGAGCRKVAELTGKLYCSLGLLAHGRVSYFRRKDLMQGGSSIEMILRKVLASCAGGMMCVEEAGDFYDDSNPQDPGMMMLGMLNEILMHENPPVIVILADRKSEMELLWSMLPDLKQSFCSEFYFDDYTPEELLEIARRKLQKRQLVLEPAAADKLMKLLREKSAAGDPEAGNGAFWEEEIGDMALRMAKRLMTNRKAVYGREEMMLIRAEDVFTAPELNRNASLEQVGTLIGSEELKQSIVHHLNYVWFIRERRRLGFEDLMPSLNMIFCGNPGTGKFTVAKMLGEIYCSAGILKSSRVIKQNGRNLAVESGIPPDQAVADLWEEAGGGILYIGESCGLLQTPAGLAVFEALLASLSPEVHEGKVAILADIPEETDKMMQVNPGLKMYFPFRFNFTDYTPAELLNIAERKLKEKNFVLHPKARMALENRILNVYNGKDKYFGNAIWVGKMVEAVIHKMSDRLMELSEKRTLTLKEMTTIMVADIPEGGDEIPGFRKDVFDEEEIRRTLEDMDQFVGQSRIKRQIRDFVELARHYSQQGIKLHTKLALQWCFTGNTGMGKKALSRIIARLYKAMGIVEKAEVYHLQVEKLIGLLEEEARQYIGRLLLEAHGGILLLDEDSEQLTRTSGIRERVRAILMNQMMVNPGGCIIIYAGQRSTVESFKADAGNQPNIVNILVFENYSHEELMQMLKRKLAGENMKMTVSAQQHMSRFIERLMATEERNRASARLMRSVAGWIVQNCERRISKNSNPVSRKVVSVTIADVRNFDESLLTFLLNERRKIGFMPQNS